MSPWSIHTERQLDQGYGSKDELHQEPADASHSALEENGNDLETQQKGEAAGFTQQTAFIPDTGKRHLRCEIL